MKKIILGALLLVGVGAFAQEPVKKAVEVKKTETETKVEHKSEVKQVPTTPVVKKETKTTTVSSSEAKAVVPTKTTVEKKKVTTTTK